MDQTFYDAFLIISSTESQDPNVIQEADSFLCTILEENPTQFLIYLLEIINNLNIPSNVRLNAIKSLTIPIQKKKIPQNLDLQTILPQLLETLHRLIPLEGSEEASNFSKAASDTFVCYANSLPASCATVFINSLFEHIQEGISLSYFKKLLYIMSDISYYQYLNELKGQYVSTLFNFIQTLQGDDLEVDEITHFFLLTIGNILKSFDFQEAGEEFTGSVLNIVWQYAPDFPSETSLIFESVVRGYPDLFVKHSEVAQSYMEVLQTSLMMYPFLNIWNSLFYHESSEIFLRAQWENMLGYCIAIIEDDTSDEVIIEDEEANTTNKTVCAIRLIDMIISLNEQECIPVMLKYIHEHIDEQGTPSKFLSSIFAATIATAITDDILSGNTEIQHNIEERDEILFKMLQDESPRVLQQAVREATGLINDKQLIPTEELLEYAFQLFASENNIISDISTKLIAAIANSELEGVRESVMEMMESIIEAYQDVPKVAESLRTMTEIAKKTTPESAALMIERLLELSQILLEEHFTDPTVSPCIGYLTQLIRNAGQLSADYLEPCIAFASQLLERDFEDDGMGLLSALLDIFGDASSDLIQIAIEQVEMNFGSFTNELHLRALIELATSTVAFIEDSDSINNLVISCLEYLDKPNNVIPSATKKSLILLLASINLSKPEVIAAHAEEILQINTIYVSFYNKKGEIVLQMLLNIANSAPDGCENFQLLTLLLQALKSVARKTFPISSNRADVSFQILLLINKKTPNSFSQSFMPINVITYNNLEKIFTPERQKVLHELVSKPEV